MIGQSKMDECSNGGYQLINPDRQYKNQSQDDLI